jgi:esterase/lipase superfamily enzyme
MRDRHDAAILPSLAERRWSLAVGRSRFCCHWAAASVKILGRMNREYHKNYSHELQRDMEALVFGHAGQPLLVFPTSRGRFFEYEDAGMIRALAPKIDQGKLQVFCPDSVDGESWYNKGVHPGSRIWRHVQYERYVID